ncbi:MAG: hypothetical protein JWN98_1490 [Abditibacteriota bacterium]|nr:hypothetical protein [Abditibacteriota bacterium]
MPKPPAITGTAVGSLKDKLRVQSGAYRTGAYRTGAFTGGVRQNERDHKAALVSYAVACMNVLWPGQATAGRRRGRSRAEST